jgi:hypothetical protein
MQWAQMPKGEAFRSREMSSTHEPIHELEPSNLLEPSNWSYQQPDSWNLSASHDRNRLPPQQLEDKMILDHDVGASLLSASRGSSGRTALKAVAIVVLAVVGFGAGAWLPELARTNFPGGKHRAVDAQPAVANKSAASTNEARAYGTQQTADTKATVSDQNVSANHETVRADERPSAGVPCDRQTWPNFNSECLKGAASSTGASTRPVRTVVPDRNSNGSPRTPSVGAVANAPPSPPLASSPARSNGGNQAPAPQINGSVRPSEWNEPRRFESRSTAFRERPLGEGRQARDSGKGEGRRTTIRDKTNQQPSEQDGVATSSPPGGTVTPNAARSGNEGADTPRQPARRVERQTADTSRKGSRRRDRDDALTRRDDDGQNIEGTREDRGDDESFASRLVPGNSRYIILRGGAEDW